MPGLDIEEYHSDKTAVSSSHVRKILKSPRAFHASFVEGRSKPPTESMKFGTLAHMAILEGQKFRDRYVVSPDFGDMRSSKNRAVRDGFTLEQKLAGKAVCSQEDFDSVVGMVEAIVEHKDAFELLKNGEAEVSGYFADDETKIKCRIRPDFVSFNMGSLVDVKTAREGSIEKFTKSMVDLGYYFQLAMYTHGAMLISNKQIRYGSFIVVEPEYPHEVDVFVMDDAWMEIGMKDYRKAMRRLKGCLETNQWPKRQQQMQNIFPPDWLMKRYGDV